MTFSKDINATPSAFAFMLNAFLFDSNEPKEIVIVGSGKDSNTKLAKAGRNRWKGNPDGR